MTANSVNAEEVVDEFIRRVVAKDLDGACELVADDVEYDNVPMGKNTGPDGIKAVLGPLVDGVETVEFVVHRQLARDNVVMNERNDRFLINGQWLELPVMGVFEVDDRGRIGLWRDYFDLPTLMNQLTGS
jgi:limonene-1,2-epoxide hydrolase